MPSVGGDESTPEDREKAAEQEKLRQEAIKQAEQERRVKHKKMEEQRENMRQGIRDRVSYRFALYLLHTSAKISHNFQLFNGNNHDLKVVVHTI